MTCIHWVEKADLPALEHVMQHKLTERVNVGVMMAGQGAVRDVWSTADTFLKERRRRAEAKANEPKVYSPAQEAARRWEQLAVDPRISVCAVELGMSVGWSDTAPF